MTGVASSDIYIGRMTFIIAVINAVAGLAIDADGPARVVQRTLIAVPAPVYKAFAAGVGIFSGQTSAYHNIPLAAIMVHIIGAVLCRTFQFRHFSSLSAASAAYNFLSAVFMCQSQSDTFLVFTERECFIQ